MALNRASLDVPDCVRNGLTDVTKARGWKNPQFHVEAGSNDGDGYLSVLYRIKIQNKNESISLISKATMASMEESSYVKGAFKSEIFMYNKVLPAMEEIAHLRNPLPWPRGYPTDIQSPCLLMEDLRPDGFSIPNRGEVLNVERCRLLLSQLARFHGAGMALGKLRPDLITAFRGIVDDPLWQDEMRRVYEPWLRAGVNATDLVADRFPEGSAVNEKLKEMFSSFPNDFFEYLKADPEGGNTIVHGDCHVNNVLFRQNEAGASVDCRLIDFQIVRYAWPAPDLTFILLTMTEKATRDEHWDALMRAYHDELQATLRAAGIQDPDAVYSWNTFQRHLRRAAKMAVCVVPVLLHAFCDDTVVKDIQATMSQLTSEGPTDSVDVHIKDTPVVRRRFGDAVQSVIEWGWL